MLRCCLVVLALSACHEAAPAPAPHFGDLMTQVGRRFELLGRAMQARRWELADFELGELGESFDDIPSAQVPRDVKGDIPQLAKTYVPSVVTPLQDAVAKRDMTAAATAFAAAAKACNSCHQATARSYIEIPDELGESVPRLGPIPTP